MRKAPLARWLPDVSRGTVAALLLVTPVAAPVAHASGGFAGTGNISHGSATIVTSGGIQTITIPTSSPVTTIDWTANDTAAGGGAIDFLPAGNRVDYIGTAGAAMPYNVLNRIIPVDRARAIAFKGTVNSTANTHVWFYSPGGLLIGATAKFNVGGLVLTAADPVADRAGNFISTTSGTDSFSVAAATGSTSAVTIQPGAVIKALSPGQSNYIVAIAPQIDQGGRISVAGSVALVAAESASFAVDGHGLFNITVSAGTTVAHNTFVHTGSTGGSNPDTRGNYQRVYMVAVPKNNAVAMAIAAGGSIGFAVADAANLDGNEIVLSAGSNIADTGSGNPVVAGRVGTGTGSLTVGAGKYTSNTYAVSTDTATVTDPSRNSNFASNLAVVAPQATVNAQAGTIAVTGNLTVDADDTLTGTGGTASLTVGRGVISVGGDALVSASGSWGGGELNDGSIHTLGGTAQITVTGRLDVGGSLTVAANGDASGSNSALSSTRPDNGAYAFGGSANLRVNGASASLTVGSGIAATADAISGITPTDTYDYEMNGATATGGTALVEAASGGTISVGVNGGIRASATASAAALLSYSERGDGGNSFGGTAQIIANAGTITVAGTNGIGADAEATGGVSPATSGSGGNATGGTALIAIRGASGTITTNTSGSTGANATSFVDAVANGADAKQYGAGGNATGGTATLETTGANQFITLDHAAQLGIAADATAGAGAGTGGGSAIGGTAGLLASGGAIAITNTSLLMEASAAGGHDASATGGNATGGTVRLAAGGGGTMTADLTTSLLASATGGYGSGNGGNAVGGNILIDLGNNAFNFGKGAGSIYLDARFTGGTGDTAGTAASAGGVRVTDLGTLELASSFELDSNTPFYVQAGGSIDVSGSINDTNNTAAYAHLWADDLGTGSGTVTLGSGVLNLPGSQIDIYYNPTSLGTPTDFSAGVKSGNWTAYQLVDDIAQLQSVGSHLSQNFALGKNIDASATQGWNSGAGFVPIGSYASAFTGNFDGLDHTIANLYVNLNTGSRYAGLFGQVDVASNNVSIRNTGLVNENISGYIAGGLIGYVGYINAAPSAGTAQVIIENAYSSGNITSTYDGGGLVGIAVYANSGNFGTVISNSHSDADVMFNPRVPQGQAFGGLIGYAVHTQLQDVFATGSVTSSNSGAFLGGLIGYGQTITVNNAYATGAVTGGANTYFMGGFIGYLEEQNSTSSQIDTAYATGTVTAGSGSTGVGGFAGTIYDGTNTVNDSWASGAVSAPDSRDVGGFAGGSGGTVTNSYWDSYSTGQTSGIGRGNGSVTNLNPVTSNPADRGSDNYAFGPQAYGDLTPGNWVYDNGTTRPVGQWETPVAQFGVANISSAHQVQLIDLDLAGNYAITQNIDLRGTGETTDIWGQGGFMPLGRLIADPPFIGTLEGAGHVLSKLTIASTGGFANAGLIQQNEGTIRDLGLADVTITSANSDTIGAIAGINLGQISDSFATGTIAITGHAAKYGLIGGLVGLNDANLAATGSVNGTYASVAITGGLAVGGLVGDNQGAIGTSYANGPVSGTLTGGLVGRSTGDSRPTVTNSYWDTQATRQGAGCGSVADAGACSGVTGLSTAQTLQSASFAGFTIDTQGGQGLPWRQYEGKTAPLLEAFLTPISVQPGSLTMQYDAQTPKVGVTVYGAQPAATFGTAQVAGLTSNAGTADLTYRGGLYSNQEGYDFVSSTSPGTLVITPAPLTLAATSDSRVYDATTGSAGVVQVSGLLGQDRASATQSFFSPNALGTNGSLLSVDPGYVVSDGNGGRNYSITLQTATGTITPAALTLAAMSDTRGYNATTTGAGVQVSGLVGSDSVGNLSASFTSPNVLGTNGSTLNVNPGYIINDGNEGFNYTVTRQSARGTITPAALAITYSATADASTYGTTPSGLSGTVGAIGLQGNDTLASVSSGAASFTTTATGLSAVGSYAITGSGLTASSSNYTFAFVQAPGNAAALTIVQRALTLTANPLSRVYGSANPISDTATAAAANAATGLVNGDSVTGETVTSPATPGSSVGSYALNGSAARFGSGLASNYAITYAASPTGLAVTPAAATITYSANAQNSTYGNTPNGLSGSDSATGLVNGDTIGSVVSGAASFATTATGLSNVGRYAITGAGLAGNSGNYSFTFVQAPGNATALTIVQRALVLTADPLARVYGGTNPTSDTATATAATAGTGLVNNDRISSESVSSPAAAGSAVGSYPLNGAAAQFASGLAANYAITYAANSAGLTITPATATIVYAANPASSIYGNTPDGLSGSESAVGLVNGDTLGSVTSGTAGFATTATGLSNVGSYAINGSGLTGATGNYSFSFVQAAGNATALTIVQRALTLTADPLARIYGSANPTSDTVGAMAATATTGLVNGNTIGSETVSSPATASAGTGSYVLNGSGAQFTSGLGSNYAISYATNATGLTITPAAVAITYVANPLSSIYGNAPTGLSGSESVSGLVNGDTLSGVTSGTAGFATTATGLSNVGAYPIIGSGLSGNSGNYSFSFAQAAGNATALTIVQRALTVTADPLSRVYGSPNPVSDSVTATAATGTGTGTGGLVNGDTIASETVASPATSGSDVGSYALHGSAAQFGSGTATNYAITYAADPSGLSITPAALTLTYTASPGSSIYGRSPAGLTGGTELTGLVNDDSAARITSGAAVWTSPANATSHVGTYAITGSGIGLASSNYTLSTVQASGNATALTVNPAALSITYIADPASRTYGAQNPPLSGTETASGLVNQDTLGSVTSGAASYVGNPAATANVGHYAITGTGLAGTSANYSYSFVQAPANSTALTIAPAPVTIVYTATPQTSIYGNVPGGLTGFETASGLVNDDTLAGITSGTASYVSAATSASRVGSYAVAGAGLTAGSSNYSFSFVQAPGNATALTITPRPITVTADPQLRGVGLSDPVFTYVVTGPANTTGTTAPGLVNGDMLTGQLASTATITSPAGTYDIVQGTLAASPNYQLTYVGNVLTLDLAFTPIQEIITAIVANLPDQTGTTTPDQRREQEQAVSAALATGGGLHPPQISQSMINDHLVTTPPPVNEPVTSNGNSSLWNRITP